MNPQEIKKRLARALQREISESDWRNLERRDVVGEYLRNPFGHMEEENCLEFRENAHRELHFLRQYREDYLREQAGELVETPRDNSVDHHPENVQVVLDERTSARSLALGALNRLCSGGSALPRAAMASTMLPRGGVDGTVPQLVWVMAAELWIPAEE